MADPDARVRKGRGAIDRYQELSTMETVRKKIIVTQESGGNRQRFIDTDTGQVMTRAEFVHDYKRGAYKGYHLRIVYIQPSESKPIVVDLRREHMLAQVLAVADERTGRTT